jgi:amino acid permease
MAFWDNEKRFTALWIAIFFVVPIVFNFLYVRRLGEIEYWLTTTKIILILILIVTGLLIGLGLSTDPLLGTSSGYWPVPCSANEIGDCVPGPGLVSICPH